MHPEMLCLLICHLLCLSGILVRIIQNPKIFFNKINNLHKNFWCGWRDLNPHALRHQNLNLACLPISPHPHRWSLEAPRFKRGFYNTPIFSVKGKRALSPSSHKTCPQATDRLPQRAWQIFGNKAGAGGPTGRAMKPNGLTGCFKCWNTLCQQANRDPGKNIPGSGGCEKRRRVSIDCSPAVRRRNDRVRAF